MSKCPRASRPASASLIGASLPTTMRPSSTRAAARRSVTGTAWVSAGRTVMGVIHGTQQERCHYSRVLLGTARVRRTRAWRAARESHWRVRLLAILAGAALHLPRRTLEGVFGFAFALAFAFRL